MIAYRGDTDETRLELKDKVEEAIAFAEEYGSQDVLKWLYKALSHLEDSNQ